MMEGEIHLYAAKGTANEQNARFEAGTDQGLLVFVNPLIETSDTQIAVYAERSGWSDVQLFQKGTISQELVEEKGDPHLSAWLDARQDGLAVIVFREE